MSTRSLQERSVRNCLTDEGRPLEVGLQERTSNHLSAAVDKSHGREHGRKRPGETGPGVRQEEDCKETTIEVSKPIRHNDPKRTVGPSFPRSSAMRDW